MSKNCKKLLQKTGEAIEYASLSRRRQNDNGNEVDKGRSGKEKKRKKSLTETKSSAYNTRLTETGCSALS
jgi:hypothetical protein